MQHLPKGPSVDDRSDLRDKVIRDYDDTYQQLQDALEWFMNLNDLTPHLSVVDQIIARFKKSGDEYDSYIDQIVEQEETRRGWS